MLRFAIALSSLICFEAAAATLECTCVARQGLCASRAVDGAGDFPRHRWSQPYTPPSDVDSASWRAKTCWNKRTASGLGDDMCCSNTDNEDDATRFFSGVVKP